MSVPSKVISLLLTALLLVLFVDGCASAPSSIDVPEKLQPGSSETLAMIVPAKGVQIYECRAAKEGTYDWAFIAPEAELFDESGQKKIGKHFAGPHWESADGSIVAGATRERADAPTANAIPWLLLSAKSVGRQGVFANVTSIQRVHTAGGVAPKGCFEAEAGMRLRVGYTADYYFYTLD